MKASVRIERKGKSFSRLSDDTRVALQLAIIDNANDLQETMQGLAPVDTGFLRDNIVVVQQGPLVVAVESQAEYSAHVNYGTRFMAAQPFVEPAIKEVKPRNEARIVDAINDAVRNSPPR